MYDYGSELQIVQVNRMSRCIVRFKVEEGKEEGKHTFSSSSSLLLFLLSSFFYSSYSFLFLLLLLRLLLFILFSSFSSLFSFLFSFVTPLVFVFFWFFFFISYIGYLSLQYLFHSQVHGPSDEGLEDVFFHFSIKCFSYLYAVRQFLKVLVSFYK